MGVMIFVTVCNFFCFVETWRCTFMILCWLRLGFSYLTWFIHQVGELVVGFFWVHHHHSYSNMIDKHDLMSNYCRIHDFNILSQISIVLSTKHQQIVNASTIIMFIDHIQRWMVKVSFWYPENDLVWKSSWNWSY